MRINVKTKGGLFMAKKYNSYSKELKLKACDMYLNQGFSCTCIMKELNIRDEKRIRKWAKIYSERGKTAFDEETRGRFKGIGKGRQKTNFNSLEKEVEFLRMENDFLKKLEALQRQ